MPNGWDDQAAQAAPVRPRAESTDRATVAYLGNLATYTAISRNFSRRSAPRSQCAPGLAGRIKLDFVGMKDPDTKRRASTPSTSPDCWRHAAGAALGGAGQRCAGAMPCSCFNPTSAARGTSPARPTSTSRSGRRILLYGEGGELEPLLSTYPAATIGCASGDAAGLGRGAGHGSRRESGAAAGRPIAREDAAATGVPGSTSISLGARDHGGVQRNRSGQSAAFVIPMRGVTRTSRVRPPDHRSAPPPETECIGC